MKRSLPLLLALISCGNGKTPDPRGGPAPAASTSSARPKAPPATKLCKAARKSLGPQARCVETPLPELTSPAGTVTRVHDAQDPVKSYVYALTKPSGEIVIDRGSGRSSGGLVETILKELDPKTTPPLVLANLYAELYFESAVVRCLDGSDKLPRCVPPTFAGDQLTAVVETFPDPRLFNRDRHELWLEHVKIAGGRFHESGEGLGEPDPGAKRPAGLPPLPDMTTAPDWSAKPVAAPTAVSDALCAAARPRYSGFEKAQCQAFAYPELKLPNGALYYLANDAGQRYPLAFQKTDGTIVTGPDLDTDSPLTPLIKSYDPAVVPPAMFLAAALIVHPAPAKIRCLGDDKIPDVDCKPPEARKQDDGLVVTAIIEELPLPDEHGSVSDPAIRRTTWEFTPGGGFSSNGTRLVDLRDPE